MTDLIRSTGASPFDSIRRVRPDGSEYWSARDVQPLMGYATWRNFIVPIERAMQAAENQGLGLATNFAGSRKITATKPQDDFDLSRFAAYLVAMNGDPNKPEVAAAQAYFAIRTHEAEVAERRPQIPTDYAAALRAAADEHEQRIAAESRALALEGPAAERDLYRSSEGLQLVGDVANRFLAYAKDRFPGVKVTHDLVRDHAGRLDLIIRGETVRNNQPTSRAIRAGWAKPAEHSFETNTRGTQRKVTTRLTVLGESRLWDGLIAFVVQNGTLTISKEIAA